MSKSLVKPFVLLFSSSLMLLGSYKMMNKSNAAASNPSGKFGCVFNVRTSADGALQDGQNRTVNAGAVLDFDAGTISYSTTRQQKTSGQNDTWTRFPAISQPLSVAVDPDGVPNSWQVSFSEQNFTLTARIISVNSGNTYLMQGMNLGTTGVCQKL